MASWLIAGVGSGFGRVLAEAVVCMGDTVARTLRNTAAKAGFEQRSAKSSARCWPRS